jgi:uncharacterized protein (TIGR02246 family)
MKTSSFALKILAPLSFVLLAACNPFPSSSTSTPAATVDTAEVRTAVDTYIAKVSARDGAGAGEVFANDPAFRWIASGRVVYDSRATAIQGLTNFLTGFPESVFKVHDIKIDAIGDAEAVAVLTFTQTVGANGQTAITFEGILTLTLVKREEGWRIIQGHASTGQLPH